MQDCQSQSDGCQTKTLVTRLRAARHARLPSDGLGETRTGSGCVNSLVESLGPGETSFVCVHTQ